MDTFIDVKDAMGFLGEILHDLGHPINSIHAIAEDAQLVEINSQRRSSWAKYIASLAKIAERQIFNATLVAKHSLGLEPYLQQERMDNRKLEHLLYKVASQFEALASFSEVKILTPFMPDKFPNGLELWLDPSLIRQAIGNILENAVMYSYNKTEVSVGYIVCDETITISFNNKGIQMSTEEISHCMEFRWRGKQHSWVYRSGHGIGLWVAKAIVEAHGGQISVTSDENLTTFELILGLQYKERNNS